MLIFLKLGGSLITDKTRPYSPRREQINTLAKEIATALQERPDLQLIIGHGSGSFGHQAASQYNTRNGVEGKEAWWGFSEVWHQAAALNRLVQEALHRERVPAVTISPFSSVTARDGQVIEWNLFHIKTSLEHGLKPVIQGDVIFDDKLGGTILSTEELFLHLGKEMRPGRILLAGREEGVWQDFPQREILVEEMTPDSYLKHRPSLGEGLGVDITGGMQTKVAAMLSLVETVPELEVLIFSGEKSGNVHRALCGETPGTRIHS